MSRRLHAGVIVAILLGIIGWAPAAARAQSKQPEPQPQAVPGPCARGTLPHGALSMICIPSSGWNGDLVLWGHGYTAFNVPLDFQHLQLPDGTSIPDLVQGLGFAFATTSYRQNGLAIVEGVDDMRELIAAFRQAHGVPRYTYATGASEGGIITTLLVERSPDLVSGGLAMCGPVGDFRGQINYWGDFRVLFDYFFPGVLPGSPIDIPAEAIANWESVYVPAIKAALAANPGATAELLRTSKAPTDANDPSTIENTALTLLWYSVFATNDGRQKLGGNPFDNRSRVYIGSNNDFRLNLKVRRFRADAAALESMKAYETSGNVTRPLVQLHTTGDQLIPIWHQVLYIAKVRTSGKGIVTPVPVPHYGHCNFTSIEILGSLGLLIFQVSGTLPIGLPVLNQQQIDQDFKLVQRQTLERPPFNDADR